MKPGKKPKKGPAPAPKPGGWRSAVRPLLAVLLTTGITLGVLSALGWLDHAARRQIRDRDRYTVPFADIQCDMPAGLTRADFLLEVRYASNGPETFQLLDPKLQTRLTPLFQSHPWVEAVEGVTVLPPAEVQVKLRFRTPFLAIHTDDGKLHAVDSHGVLLPPSGLPAGITEVFAPLARPTTPAGTVWATTEVNRVLELAKLYPLRRLDRTPKGWRLTRKDGAVLLVTDR